MPAARQLWSWRPHAGKSPGLCHVDSELAWPPQCTCKKWERTDTVRQAVDCLKGKLKKVTRERVKLIFWQEIDDLTGGQKSLCIKMVDMLGKERTHCKGWAKGGRMKHAVHWVTEELCLSVEQSSLAVTSFPSDDSDTGLSASLSPGLPGNSRKRFTPCLYLIKILGLSVTAFWVKGVYKKSRVISNGGLF